MKAYLFYKKQFIEGVLSSENVDYSSPDSVKIANKSVDKYRCAAKKIGQFFPDKISDFSQLLGDNRIRVSVCAAVCLIELMPHTRDELQIALKVIEKYRNICDEPTKYMIDCWLKGDCCNIDRCSDWSVTEKY